MFAPYHNYSLPKGNHFFNMGMQICYCNILQIMLKLIKTTTCKQYNYTGRYWGYLALYRVENQHINPRLDP